MVVLRIRASIASPAHPDGRVVVERVRQQMLEVVGYLLLLRGLRVVVLLRWLVDVMHCPVFNKLRSAPQ